MQQQMRTEHREAVTQHDTRKLPEPHPYTSLDQRIAVWIARGLSLVIFIMLFSWIFDYGEGLGWEGDEYFFSLHPFLMILGIPCLLTNGVLAWRETPFRHHNVVKALHFFFNVCALVCVFIGLYVTVTYNSSPHIVTLHAWIAITAFTLLCLQALGGITFFLFPIFSQETRARVLPAHGWAGAVGYLMLMMTVIIGIVEWMAYRHTTGAGGGVVGGGGEFGDRSAYDNEGFTQMAQGIGIITFFTALAATYALLPKRDYNFVKAPAEATAMRGAATSTGATTTTTATTTATGSGAAAGRAAEGAAGSAPFGVDPVPQRRTVEAPTAAV